MFILITQADVNIFFGTNFFNEVYKSSCQNSLKKKIFPVWKSTAIIDALLVKIVQILSVCIYCSVCKIFLKIISFQASWQFL